MAFALGFAKGMQYEGLRRESDNLGTTEAILTNCFACSYGFMTSLDIAGYNRATMWDTPGSFKGFDVLFIDPIKVFADGVVTFEMCEMKKILSMITNNASLDYASIAESTTRALMVIMMESPEARQEIMKVREAA